jgi:hypothetical protein
MKLPFRSVSAGVLSLTLAFLFTSSKARATDEIVYYCAITSSSPFTAPTSGTVLVSCPTAIPANTIQAGDTFEWELEGEENAPINFGGGTTGYKFYLSSTDMVGTACKATIPNNSQVWDFTYRGWDTVGTNGSSATSISAYECLMIVNGTPTPFHSDDNPGFDTTVALTPKVVAAVNFPSGLKTQVFTFIVKLIR